MSALEQLKADLGSIPSRIASADPHLKQAHEIYRQTEEFLLSLMSGSNNEHVAVIRSSLAHGATQLMELLIMGEVLETEIGRLIAACSAPVECVDLPDTSPGDIADPGLGSSSNQNAPTPHTTDTTPKTRQRVRT